MKKIVWFVFLCCIMVGQPVWAQNKVTEQQKVEYDKGNRDQKYLKEYIEALKADGQTEILNGVVDEYLMVLPLNATTKSPCSKSLSAKGLLLSIDAINTPPATE